MLVVSQKIKGVLDISCKYYPDYISRLKSIGGVFDKESKIWTMPLINLEFLLDTFEGELFFQTPLWELTGEKPPDYSNLYKFNNPIDVSKLGFKLNPFAYQEFGIQFIVDRLKTYGMAFIADAMGLGKTLQAIGSIKYFSDNNDVNKIVIVCKKSLKNQWKTEIEKFIDFDGDIFIAEDSKVKRLKTYKAFNENKRKSILMVNYHLLLNDSSILKPDFVAFDEVHGAKKYNGKINIACREITKKAKYCLFMTGTPIMTRPTDMFGIISIKDKKYFGKLREFNERYVVEYFNGSYTDIVGYKNLDELRDKMQHLILRRTSDEVDVELPSVVSTNIYIDMDKKQKDASSIAKEISDDILEKVEDVSLKLKDPKTNEGTKIKLKETLAKYEAMSKGLIATRQAIANSPILFNYTRSKKIKHDFKDVIPPMSYVSPKYKALVELLEDIKESGNKAILFTKYETVVSSLINLFSLNKIDAVPYSGSMDDISREHSISQFKNDDDTVAIIGTDALAEGVNLNWANTVINVDLAYNQAINDQRTGRSCRVGSAHKVTFVYNLITRNSIDENIYNKILETKNAFNSFISVDKAQSKLLKELSN